MTVMIVMKVYPLLLGDASDLHHAHLRAGVTDGAAGCRRAPERPTTLPGPAEVPGRGPVDD